MSEQVSQSIADQINAERIKGALAASGTEVPQNWSQLSVHLEEQGLYLDLDIQPMQFASGFGNLNYLIKLDDSLAVLRRPPMGPIPPGANDMRRENFILSRLPGAYPLAPRALHYCESPDVLGAHFLIMEYRPGLIISSEVPKAVLQDWREPQPLGECLSEHLISALAKLHQVDPKAIGLDKLGKPEGFVPRTVKGWCTRAELAWENNLPSALTRVIAWLQGNQPEDLASCFIHNDFKLDNMILDPSSLQPMAVIDWDMGTQGAPLYDLAVLLSYWTEAGDPDCMHVLKQMPTADHGFLSREAVALRYAELTGTSLQHLKFFRVLASLRIAVVFRQLYCRYQEGGAENMRYAQFDELSAQLAEFGLSVIENKAF